MRLMDIQAKTKRKKRRTTNSEHDFPRYPNLIQDLEIVRPDQVWTSDVTYIRLRYDFVYLAVIMDVFTRRIRGWRLGRSLDHTLTLTALQRAWPSILRQGSTTLTRVSNTQPLPIPRPSRLLMSKSSHLTL